MEGGSTDRLLVPVKLYWSATVYDRATHESNWVPTKAGARFEVLFRFYGPEKPLFDKTWKLNDIDKAK